jgi:hypothetical protein
MTGSAGPGAETDDERATRRGPREIETDDEPRLDTERSWTRVAGTRFDPESDEDLAVTIVETIAAAEGVDPAVLDPPLYEVVDASAIQQSFFGSGSPERVLDATGVTQFRYGGYLVEVRSDGCVQVYD